MPQIYKKVIVSIVFLLTFNLISTGFVNAKMFTELSTGEKIYWITGSVLITPAYLPFKVIYTGIGLAGSGAVFLGTAGFARQTALDLAKRSIGGDWYIHPDYLLGNQKIRLFEPPAVISTPVAAPEAEVAPTPAPAPTPEAAPAPQTTPEPEAAPTPAPETTPAPQTTPAPEPETVPAPAPTPEAAPAPQTTPAPQTAPAPAPEVIPAPAPEAAPAK